MRTRSTTLQAKLTNVTKPAILLEELLCRIKLLIKYTGLNNKNSWYHWAEWKHFRMSGKTVTCLIRPVLILSHPNDLLTRHMFLCLVFCDVVNIVQQIMLNSAHGTMSRTQLCQEQGGMTDWINEWMNKIIIQKINTDKKPFSDVLVIYFK